MKTEVYSWRVSTEVKSALEAGAKRENISLAALLDRMARQWIKDRRAERLDDAEQVRLQAAAARFRGALSLGAGPYNNEAVRKRIQQPLAQKYGRKLPR